MALLADGAPARRGGWKRLVLLAIPFVLLGVTAGLWFTGVLPPLVARLAGAKLGAAQAAPPLPVFAELPDILASLNGGPRRNVYVKLHVKLELRSQEDARFVQAAMPRLLDLFQSYLREMRPEELRGSPGTYRLREELMARANIALAPVRIQDMLFTELLIQ